LAKVFIPESPTEGVVEPSEGAVRRLAYEAADCGNCAIAESSIHVLIRLGPAFEVEDWYVRSGGRRHLLYMIRSR
jgi:hypothetical protein